MIGKEDSKSPGLQEGSTVDVLGEDSTSVPKVIIALEDDVLSSPLQGISLSGSACQICSLTLPLNSSISNSGIDVETVGEGLVSLPLLAVQSPLIDPPFR